MPKTANFAVRIAVTHRKPEKGNSQPWEAEAWIHPVPGGLSYKGEGTGASPSVAAKRGVRTRAPEGARA